MDDLVEIEFRDGMRLVPRYLVDLFVLAGLDTSVHTYPQAVDLANQGVVKHRLNTFAADLVAEHLRNEIR